MRLGPDEMVKYPFLEEVGQYLVDLKFTLDQFVSDPDLNFIVDMAFERIRVAAEGGIYRADLDMSQDGRDGALPKEAISFLIAVVMLKMAGMRTLIRRFSLAEARRSEAFLSRDLKKNLQHNEPEVRRAIELIHDLFSVRVKRDEHDDYAIPVPDYLVRSAKFNEREWKLANRRVSGGSVFLMARQIARLFRVEFDSYINSKIMAAKTPSMIPGFERYVERLVDMGKKLEPVVVYTGKYPPCIKHAIAVLEKGENLPHAGRFMLGTFLLSGGKQVSDVAPLFKNAPDYNERVTMYQLNNLAGTGGGTKYSCPGCDKLRTQDLCFATSECDGISHPLQFGRKRT